MTDKLAGDVSRVFMVQNQSFSGLEKITNESIFKVIKLKLDLACVFESGSPFSEVLELFYSDFEKTFLCRSESESVVLPKRVFISRNGIKISIYINQENEYEAS